MGVGGNQMGEGEYKYGYRRGGGRVYLLYVCIYKKKYHVLQVYVHIHIYIYIYIYVCVCMYVYIFINVCSVVCSMYIYLSMYVVCVCVYVCSVVCSVYIYLSICIHIYLLSKDGRKE